MNQWGFVIAAYAMFLSGTGGLLAWALLSCRQVEQRAERLGRKE